MLRIRIDFVMTYINHSNDKEGIVWFCYIY